MKRMRLTFILFLLPAILSAQTIWKEMDNRYDRMRDSVSEARSNKDYRACEKITKNFLAYYDSICRSDTEHIMGFDYIRYLCVFKYGNLYNLACYQSLQNKKEEALESLELSLENGEYGISYREMSENKDLDNIRNEERFQEVSEKFKETCDYVAILRKDGEYKKEGNVDEWPKITYLPENDSNLMNVRKYFRLDSVAGDADELTKIKKVLTYIHDMIRHDGSASYPAGGHNSINYAEACKNGKRGLNCRQMATVLNECYLSMGIKSRVITCNPKRYVNDCHVINAVFSKTLGKWLWIDPSFNAWVTDKDGNMLGIREVREYLRKGIPVKVNEEANWNNETKTTTEQYLYEYMAKNLYYLEGWAHYGFGTESRGWDPKFYIALASDVYFATRGLESQISSEKIVVSDDAYFWQSPD